MMFPENNLQRHIATLLNVEEISFRSVGGGSINSTWQIGTEKTKFFCKINDAGSYPAMFEKEAAGLKALADAKCIGTPQVIAISQFNDQQILLLEWMEQGTRNNLFWKNFGQQLAKLHSIQNTESGFDHGNYMGALPQNNTWTPAWHEFFKEYRLIPQVELAMQQNLLDSGHVKLFETLYPQLQQIFTDEPASLLHGDLWNGNFLCNAMHEPVLIDPAVYYGHAGMDLAMTTLFGGFNKSFYDAYAYWKPLPANHQEQWQVCNLYPLLIHLNLFGNSYLAPIVDCLRRFH